MARQNLVPPQPCCSLWQAVGGLLGTRTKSWPQLEVGGLTTEGSLGPLHDNTHLARGPKATFSLHSLLPSSLTINLATFKSFLQIYTIMIAAAIKNRLGLRGALKAMT